MRQWNAKLRKVTLPKFEQTRTIAMTDPVRARLLALPRESDWVFTTLRGNHYTASSRSHHWNRVRCAAGLGQMDLYTATRHYFAWYALNVLEVDQKWIALQLGHQDGGKLVLTATGTPTRGSRGRRSARRLRRHRSRPYRSTRGGSLPDRAHSGWYASPT